MNKLKDVDFYKEIAEHSSDLVQSVDAKGRFLYVNSTWRNKLKYSDEEIDKLSLWEIISPEYVLHCQEAFSRAVEGGDLDLVSTVFRSKTGEDIFLEGRVKLNLDEEGRMQSTRGVFRDVTEEKKLREELELYKEMYRERVRLQEMFSLSSAGFIEISPDNFKQVMEETLERFGRHVQADRAYIFAYDFPRNRCNNLFEWCREGIAPFIDKLQNIPLEFLEDWTEKHLRGESVFIADVEELPDFSRLKGPLLAQKIQSLLCIPLYRKGECWGFIGFDSVEAPKEYSESEKSILTELSSLVLNVFRRKEVEDNLRKILETTLDGFWIVGAGGKVIDVNKAYCEMTGYTREEIFEMSIKDFDIEEDPKETQARIQRIITNGSEIFERRHLCKDGRFIDVEIAASCLEPFEPQIACFCRDITEKKRAERELKGAKAEAEQANILKSRFLANMSHELRTPLSAIMGLLELMSLSAPSAEQREYIAEAQEASKNLLHSVESILEFSKLESGKLEVEEKNFSVRTTAKRALEKAKPAARLKDINIEADFSEQFPKLLRGDEKKLAEILDNLLSNAVKFTNKGGRAYLRIEQLAEGDKGVLLSFTVGDTGIGINENDLQKIYQAFVQGDISSTKKFAGIGLGLTITRELVNILGGEIEVKSKEAEGSEFCVKLFFGYPNPEKETGFKHGAVFESREDSALFFEHQPRILLVEDSEMNSKIVLRMLKRKGLSCDLAEDGIKALEFFKQKEYDLVFMDCQLPRMDGYECTRALRELEKGKRHTWVIALTANAMEDDRELCLAAGMDDYLSKPIDFTEMIEKIELLQDNLFAEDNRNAANNYSEQETELEKGICNFIRISGLSEEDVREIFTDFLEVSRELFAKITFALKENNLESVEKELHTYKGTSGNLRLEEVFEKTKALEEAVKDRDVELAGKIFEELRALRIFEEV